jgi:hypothetical protein
VIVERPVLERRVVASLDAGRIPVLLGGCGSGRTSTLLRVAASVGADHSRYINFASAATTPEMCWRSVTTSWPSSATTAKPASARAAFDALTQWFDEPGGDAAVTFLVDEVLDIRTFESFPGLRHVQREIVARLSSSPSRFVLTSRFTARAHRLLRDAPARFEVVHVPAFDAQEATSLALRHDGQRQGWAGDVAPAVAALSGGRAAYACLLLEGLAAMGSASDPVAALAALLAPDGRLTARCRESYEFRLQRARGYGALKAILGILADDEPLNLTEIANHLHRTPGSTKDYLSWLEDVDLVRFQGKRYAYDDPLLRLYVRLYGKPTPPTDDDIVREVAAYAKARLPSTREPVAVAAAPSSGGAPASLDEDGRDSGIIEID